MSSRVPQAKKSRGVIYGHYRDYWETSMSDIVFFSPWKRKSKAPGGVDYAVVGSLRAPKWQDGAV
jgi:hypothetical protein